MRSKLLALIPNSADGLASAALFMKAHPLENITIKICSIGTLPDAILETYDSNSIHILGVGTNEDYIDDALDALDDSKLNISQLFWYCGRNYLNEYKIFINQHCTTIFQPRDSNAEAIFNYFKMKSNKHTTFLLNLALEYKRLYEKKKAKSQVSNEWQNFVEALCETQFILGRQTDYFNSIKALSISDEWIDLYKEVISFYKNKIKDHLLTKGKSSYARAIRNKIDSFAHTNEHVLITGASGTGKDLAARDIHLLSDRSDKTYRAINCSDFQGNPDLAKSRLFGHSKGSFTGAIKDHRGLFEECHNGTIFLDELGELPLMTQSVLLRVLDSGEFEPQGGKIKTSKARVIAATNKDLRRMVREGKFREDLFYRLNVLTFELPPLTDRIEDVYLIAKSIIKSESIKYSFSKEDEYAIESYNWPGNFRELRNLIRRAFFTKTSIADCIQDEIDQEEKSNIKIELEKQTAENIRLPLNQKEIIPLKQISKLYVKHIYKLMNNNCKLTSDHLNLAINTTRKYLDL